MHTRHTTIDSPVGDLTVSAADDALTGIYFDAHRHPPRPERLGEQASPTTDPVLRNVQVQLEEYFAGGRRTFDLTLAPAGTPFQVQVWTLLRDIDFGATTTYGALAAAVGGPSMARAVGAAVGRNPISIVVPCHRVVAGTGSLTGFAGGLERKRHLLDLEGASDGVLF